MTLILIFHEPADLVPGISYYSSLRMHLRDPCLVLDAAHPLQSQEIARASPRRSRRGRELPQQGSHKFPAFTEPILPPSSPTSVNSFGNKIMMLLKVFCSTPRPGANISSYRLQRSRLRFKTNLPTGRISLIYSPLHEKH